MRKLVYKAGTQSESNPFEFVMSTADEDRMGDIVEQDWVLSHFKKNPVALWMHKTAEPIGVWERVRVEGGKLVGKLALAEKGTSELIDRIRSLIEQRILRAVSVGFMSGKAEPLDEKDPWGGFRLSKNELMECSVVTVPANQNALNVGKGLDQESRSLLLADCSGEACNLPAAKQLMSRGSGTDKSTRRTAMSLSDKIQKKLEHLSALKNQLTTLTDSIDETGDLSEDTTVEMEELNAQIAHSEKDLSTLQSAEERLRVKAAQQPSAHEQAGKPKGNGMAPFMDVKANRPKGHKAMATMACLLKAHATRQNPLTVAELEYKDEPEISITVRAATDPATMTDATWAAPLVRDTWGEFLELIRDISIYPRLPGARYDFDAFGKITLPKNNGRGSLAGGFIGEGSPIPVKEGVYGGVDLTPKKLAVISVFTREIGMHSMPAIQQLIQNQMLGDTAETLDALYLDAQPRGVTRPAGMQDTTETGAGNINASAGGTVADIIADTEAMIGRMIAARTGNGAVWIMNPLLILKLRNKQDAASGEFVFRAEITSGMFQGYPVLASDNVPSDLLTLQSNGAVAYGNDYAPMIEVSDQATIVFDDTAPDDVLPDTNTMPTKSMFQTDSIAVKMRAGLDWRIVRIGGVQVLTGVAW